MNSNRPAARDGRRYERRATVGAALRGRPIWWPASTLNEKRREDALPAPELRLPDRSVERNAQPQARDARADRLVDVTVPAAGAAALARHHRVVVERVEDVGADREADLVEAE